MWKCTGVVVREVVTVWKYTGVVAHGSGNCVEVHWCGSLWKW